MAPLERNGRLLAIGKQPYPKGAVMNLTPSAIFNPSHKSYRVALFSAVVLGALLLVTLAYIRAGAASGGQARPRELMAQVTKTDPDTNIASTLAKSNLTYYLVDSQETASIVRGNLSHDDSSIEAQVAVIDSPEARLTMGSTAMELTLVGTDVWIVDLR
jgi:hypothetical protein